MPTPDYVEGATVPPPEMRYAIDHEFIPSSATDAYFYNNRGLRGGWWLRVTLPPEDFDAYHVFLRKERAVTLRDALPPKPGERDWSYIQTWWPETINDDMVIYEYSPYYAIMLDSRNYRVYATIGDD